jgi:predicted RNA methylase
MTSRIAYNNPDANGALGLPYHYEMLADHRRLEPLRRAIFLVAKGKRVLESGAGSGVLSILAAKAGARAVYAVERDPAIARFLRKNVKASGYGAVIRVLERDTRELTLGDLDGEPVEVAIAEHLSTWQVTEPQTSVMNHVNRYLATESAVRIPQCAYQRVELVRSEFLFEGVVELRTYYFGFTGVRKPLVLSAPTLFRKVDFGAINAMTVDHAVDVVAKCDGVVNSLRLTSPLQVYGRIRFRSSDSLVPPVVVPLAEGLEVGVGDVVNIRFRYRCESSWAEIRCDARRMNPASLVSQFVTSPRSAHPFGVAESVLQAGGIPND